MLFSTYMHFIDPGVSLASPACDDEFKQRLCIKNEEI